MVYHIAIGSVNQTKVNAIKSVFPTDDIQSIAAPSSVLSQPISNEMTRTGAINRALYSLEKLAVDYSIGLEGGVMLMGEQLYLCNWGALITATGEIFTASGGLIPLPKSFKEPILQGEELSIIMERYTDRQQIGSTKGAIGIFTNGLMRREQLYVYIGTLLKGQLQFKHNK